MADEMTFHYGLSLVLPKITELVFQTPVELLSPSERNAFTQVSQLYFEILGDIHHYIEDYSLQIGKAEAYMAIDVTNEVKLVHVVEIFFGEPLFSAIHKGQKALKEKLRLLSVSVALLSCISNSRGYLSKGPIQSYSGIILLLIGGALISGQVSFNTASAHALDTYDGSAFTSGVALLVKGGGETTGDCDSITDVRYYAELSTLADYKKFTKSFYVLKDVLWNCLDPKPRRPRWCFCY